jgi:4-diphosphocytidyl-2-C-methyl-D-erythritol kinase
VSHLAANAKLTWSLHVTGVRADGLHLLEAEMVTVDLADTLELTDAGDDEPRFSARAEPPASSIDTQLGDDDLIRRALRAVGRRAHVGLVKRIPRGAGLGGGSADAAAVLRWAGVSDPSVALELGSDVPFCRVGGRAIVRGVGELIEPLTPIARAVTLAIPPIHVDTTSCYRAFDELDGVRQRHPRNDLTAAAERVAPGLAAIRQLLEERTGADFLLAGSGSTQFCEGNPLGLTAGSIEVLETKEGPVRLLLATTTEVTEG